jgi:hypothetical protein
MSSRSLLHRRRLLALVGIAGAMSTGVAQANPAVSSQSDDANAALSGLTRSEGGLSLMSDADHLQLSCLLIEFGWRVDNGTAKTIYKLFADDGELTIGAVNAVGRDAIRGWGLAVDNGQNSIHHVVSNPRFISAGPDSALGTSTLNAYLRPDGSSPSTIPAAVGEDRDQFVRNSGEWRFKSRRWITLFSRQGAAA